MRVLAVVHQFPPRYQTGTEILCLRTMQAMRARGLDVAAVAADPASDAADTASRMDVEGIATTFVPTRARVGMSVAARLEAYALGQKSEELVEIAGRFRPDLIHVHHIAQFGLRAIRKLASAAPVLFTATDFFLICPYATALLTDGAICDGPDPAGRNCLAHHRLRPLHHGLASRGVKQRALGLLARMAEPMSRERLDLAMAAVDRHRKEAFSSAALTIAGSERMRAMFLAAGADPAKLALLHHEAPPILLPDREARGPMRIGYLGTLSAHKGVHVLVEALTSLPPDLAFEAVIQGDQSSDSRYVARLKLHAAGDPRIRFVDAVPNEVYGEALGALDIVVLPSLWTENRPLTMLSAIEHGRYVIGSDVPGISQVVAESGGGCVVPPGDARALALALMRLLADPTPVRAIRRDPTRRPRFLAYIDALEGYYRSIVRS